MTDKIEQNTGYLREIESIVQAMQIINLGEQLIELNQMTYNIDANTEQLNVLGDKLEKMIVKESNSSNYQVQIMTKNTEQMTSYLREIESFLNQLIPLINQQKNAQVDLNKFIQSSLKIKP